MTNNWVKAHYLDASAAVKLVVSEVGADVIRAYFEKNAVFQMTEVCFVETLSVLKVKYFYRREISREQYEAACYLLLAYVEEGRIAVEAVASRPSFFDAREVMRAYGIDLSDALQVLTVKYGPHSPGARESKSILVTADDGLAEAARKEGLRVWHILQAAAPPAA